MTTADIINAGLLLAAVVGIALTFWQVWVGANTQRAQFLKDLYATLTTDPDICEAYYRIEYGKFVYNAEFHGSPLELKVDRLLAFVDLVAELYQQSAISEREMAFFRYRLTRMYADQGIREYLTFLSRFYKSVGVDKEPYHSFQQVASELVSKSVNEL